MCQIKALPLNYCTKYTIKRKLYVCRWPEEDVGTPGPVGVTGGFESRDAGAVS